VPYLLFMINTFTYNSRSRTMNYAKIYKKIIDFRKNNKPSGYVEKHHIIPRSLGGTNDKENLVLLTAREHFICHFLLAKMYSKESVEWFKMNHAFIIMKANTCKQNRYFNSKLYESLRKNFSQIMSLQQGKTNSQFGTKWIHNKELKVNKKISKNLPIPNGWDQGRIINWNTKLAICPNCNKKFELIKKEKYCCFNCKISSKKKSNIFKREKEFLELYSKLGSMNTALKKMGYKGAVGFYYDWAKKILDKNNL